MDIATIETDVGGWAKGVGGEVSKLMTSKAARTIGGTLLKQLQNPYVIVGGGLLLFLMLK